MTELKQKIGLIIIFLFHFGLYNLCSQTTYTFDPDTNINWSNHEKWSPSYPGETIASGDTVIIKNGVSCNLDISIENFGTIILNGELHIASFSRLTNNGTIENFGEFQLINGDLINNSELINHHIINIYNHLTHPIINSTNASITNNHKFLIYGYHSLINDGIINNSETGTLSIINEFPNNNILNNDGIIQGVGTINPNISFNNSSMSKIEPGINNIGTLSTFGNLNMGETTLIIEIDAVANENDVFAINGNAVIENTNLIIEWINNPVANEIYSIMTFTSRNGVFSSVTIPPVPGFTFAINYTDTEATITATENSLGVSDLNLDENITFWPNPIKKILNIDMGENHEVISIEIESVLGKKVYSKKFMNQSEISVNLDFESGIYLVSIITNNGGKKTFKIIKE